MKTFAIQLSQRLARSRQCLAAIAMLGVLGVAVPGNGRNALPAPPTVSAKPLLPIGYQAPVQSDELLRPMTPCLVWAPPARRMVMMRVTAYCPCPICCGPNACGVTASGNYIDYNRGLFVAADAALPFGTKLLVPGYASDPVQVIDRGSAIHGNRLDVFFATHQQATNWGHKTLPVTILND